MFCHGLTSAQRNYFEILPDHIGNNQRLFEKFGPIFKTTSLGRTSYQINDAELAAIVFAETDFFTKKINPDHPLYPIKDDQAGVFLSDTDNPAWSIVHKFLPPAFGPKAVRHYAPIMQACIESALPIFDKLEEEEESWNVYQYMVKLGAETIGKVVLGMDFDHFKEVDSGLHPFVRAIVEVLSLNKKIASKGEFFAHLPFGDPKKLKEIQDWEASEVDKVIQNTKAGGTEDLPLQDAALHATNVIDYLVRAVDSNGEKLPKENLVSAVIVASGAGFATTSTLLSWLIYGLVAYPGMQARLLQELVDNDFNDDTVVTPELIEKLEFQDKYVKEMQRINNPSYQPGRTAKTDLVLPGGYRLHEGDVVIGMFRIEDFGLHRTDHCSAAIRHIHMNPKYWDNPTNFDPDRWDSDAVKNRHKAAYCPFAVGPRSCIGFNFALQEVKLFLPKLVWRYHWDKVGEAAVQYDPYFQLVRPVNLYVRTQKRTVWPSKSDLDKW